MFSERENSFGMLVLVFFIALAVVSAQNQVQFLLNGGSALSVSYATAATLGSTFAVDKSAILSLNVSKFGKPFASVV